MDLVAEPIELLLREDQPRDPLTGRAILDPGEEFDIVITVWNRGDTRSSPVPGWIYAGQIELTIPALDPGEVHTDTIAVAASETLGFQEDVTYFSLHVALDAGEDPLHANDMSASDSFFIALPVLRATLEFPDTVREGEPINGTVTIENLSRFADMSPRPLVFCLFDFDVGCGLNEAGAPFGLTDLPVIEAGESWTTDVVVTIPSHSPYDDWDWVLVACLAEPGMQLEDFVAFEQPCLSQSRPMTVLAPATGPEIKP